MTYQNILKVVTSEYIKKYKAVTKEGKTEIVRLWRGNYDVIYKVAKGQRVKGRAIGMDVIDKWLSIALYEPTIDYKRRLLKRANDAVKMLSESKLWGNIKNEIEDFLNLPNDKIEEFVKAATSDFYENVWKDHYNTNENKKFPWLQTPNVFESFLQDRCWKSVHFSYNNDYEISRIKENIKNKKNYRTRWREKYDNSLEVKFNCEDNIARGWYSEEYKDCGNGYYYFLFDANHAIFIEKD